MKFYFCRSTRTKSNGNLLFDKNVKFPGYVHRIQNSNFVIVIIQIYIFYYITTECLMMSFYLKPPRGITTIDKLEACVNQRLEFYADVEKNKYEFNHFDCLLEDTGLDRTGHCLLRLFSIFRPSFAHRFVINEQKLLDIRLSSYNLIDLKRFLWKLVKHCQDVLKETLSEQFRKYCLFIKWLTSLMLNTNFLQHVFEKSHIRNQSCSEIFFNVPFEFCYTLIGNREFNLSYGNVKVDCRNWKRLLVSNYGIYLKIVLKEMKTNKFVENTLSDIRIKGIMNLIKERNSSQYEQMNSRTRFNIYQIKVESRLFPLCMKNLFTSLVRTNRLAHNDRFDLSLFMKGIGVTLDDSLKFWEDMYSKQHSSCSRCTHSWQKNERKYIYGIRHLYGFEGSMKNYQTRSCSFLQEKSVGPLEEGGCPLTHFDDIHLKKLLNNILPDDKETIEVMVHKRKTNAKQSCELLHRTMYRNILGCEPKKANTEFHNPVQFYLFLKDGFKESDKKQ